MAERISKQPLEDPEYTVPEYSVLWSLNEADESSVVDGAICTNAPGDNSSNDEKDPNKVAVDSARVGGVTTKSVEENNVADTIAGNGVSGSKLPADNTQYPALVSSIPASSAPVALAPGIASPVHPRALTYVMWCAAAIIVISLLKDFVWLWILWGEDFELSRMLLYIIPDALGILISSILPAIILWKLWNGRRWAHILALIYSVFYGLVSFMQIFTAVGSPAMLSENIQLADLSSSIFGVLITINYVLIVVLLISRPVRDYISAVTFARMQERMQKFAARGQMTGEPPQPPRASQP